MKKVWPPRVIRVRFEPLRLLCCGSHKICCASGRVPPDPAWQLLCILIETFQADHGRRCGSPESCLFCQYQQEIKNVCALAGKRGLERCPRRRVQYSTSGQDAVLFSPKLCFPARRAPQRRDRRFTLPSLGRCQESVAASQPMYNLARHSSSSQR